MASQIITLLSIDPEAKYFPEDEYLIETTLSSWPLRIET